MIHRSLLTACLSLGLVFAANLPAAAQSLKAGAATSNITPPLGQNVIGGFSPSPSTHVHDELHTRCIVLDDGKTRLALAVCDLVGIHELVCNEAKKQIEERFKIPRSHVLISATHTHSASSALGNDRFRYEQKLDDYQRFVAQRIADGVASAINNLRPAEMAFGTVEAPEHLFNRRWYLKPGTMPVNPFGETTDQVKMNPGAGNANLVEPAGPTDPTVSFLAFREPAGRPIAVFTAYSLHYVGGVGNNHISADYFAVYADELARLLNAERLDPPFVAVMANGTSGDVNNINFKQPRPAKKPYEQMRYVANDVAAKVKAALDGVKYRSDVTLDARFREPTLRWRHPTAEQLKWAKETVAAGPKVQRGADLSFAYAERAVRLADYPETTTVPLQTLRLGDVCIGTMPVEVFTEIGLEFKQRSAQQPAFMVELANGYMGYLPTPRQHKLGGYETWLGTSRLETEASDKLLAELVAMSEELKVGRSRK
jgi:neutral ceramidase